KPAPPDAQSRAWAQLPCAIPPRPQSRFGGYVLTTSFSPTDLSCVRNRTDAMLKEPLKLSVRIAMNTAQKRIVARRIELYGSVYKLALKHISPVLKHEQPNIVLRLHASIRRQIDEGATDPLSIASDALVDLQANETVK